MAMAVIDRFEEDKAVLLVGSAEKKVVFPAEELPEGLQEGDYIRLDISFDEEATRAAREEAAALLAALLEQPDSAPAAAAPRALRADARMKFLREILFIVRNPFCFFLLFLPKRFCLAQFDAFLTILL